jgi:chaperone modulatory protein CbpM
MIDLRVLLRQVGDVEEADVRQWIAQEWVRPSGPAQAPVFQDVDVARVRLIIELRRDLGVNEDAVPVVLSLLDQLYRERDRQRRLRDALAARVPPGVLQDVFMALSDGPGRDPNE